MSCAELQEVMVLPQEALMSLRHSTLRDKARENIPIKDVLGLSS